MTKILPAVITLLVLSAVMLSIAGCKTEVSVVDKRLSREEVMQAFQQRDEAIKALITAVKTLQGEKVESIIKDIEPKAKETK